jgi:subfamily B ATP-binding cassette protein MsbA
MKDDQDSPVSRSEKFSALRDVAQFDPKLTIIIVGLGMVAAVLEGVGLSFILPIIELVQSEGNPAAQADGIMAIFVRGYQLLNIPLTLGTAVLGVAAVITTRYTMSFLVGWFREALRTYYIRDLQTKAFENALNAKVSYFDTEGSDEILNAIITQTFYAGRVIARCIQFIQTSFISLVYLLIAFVITPSLTIFAVVVLGGITYFMRGVVEPGYDLGDRVADANEQRQEAAQAGTQGIRDVRIFRIADELVKDFHNAVEKYTHSRIKLRRNEAAIKNFYNLLVAVSVFVLIYLSLTYANLSFGSMGLFLFAMFRLGPKASHMNQLLYKIENDLPHLVRTQKFIDELAQQKEPNDQDRPAPDTVDTIEFDEVWFSYEQESDVLKGIKFRANKGEFVAFVGQSGAGKSTIVSLLARMYEPTSGQILANRTPVSEVDINEWRDRITVVRQNPYIFDDTLQYNLTIGNRDASKDELDRVCEIAKVNEFFDELPNGYKTQLGDNGVRLSGGQKQRVALARALLENVDLLILDEATSDLDSNMEQEVQREIESMDQDYTIITIAHRLSTVKNADTIYSVEDGRVSEHGTHENLIDKNGKYAELYAIQSGE